MRRRRGLPRGEAKDEGVVREEGEEEWQRGLGGGVGKDVHLQHAKVGRGSEGGGEVGSGRERRGRRGARVVGSQVGEREVGVKQRRGAGEACERVEQWVGGEGTRRQWAET